jgi:hypothetical protein
VQFLIVSYSSLSWTGLYILQYVFLSEVCSLVSSDCANVQSLCPYIRVCFTRVLYILTFISGVSNHECEYTGCSRRNGQNFRRVFLMLKYTNITQNTYVLSWTVTEIMAREKCGLLWGSTHCTCQLRVLSISVLEWGVILRLTLAVNCIPSGW